METTQKQFMASSSPIAGDKNRWIAHDPDGHFAGEFQGMSECESAVSRWNEHGCEAVTVSWITSPDGATDSHRGTYTISVADSDWKKNVCCGWHSMERCAEIAGKLRDCIARHGLLAVREVLDAIKD